MSINRGVMALASQQRPPQGTSGGCERHRPWADAPDSSPSTATNTSGHAHVRSGPTTEWSHDDTDYIPLLRTLAWIALIVGAAVYLRADLRDFRQELSDRMQGGASAKVGSWLELGEMLETLATVQHRVLALLGVVNSEARTSIKPLRVEPTDYSTQTFLNASPPALASPSSETCRTGPATDDCTVRPRPPQPTCDWPCRPSLLRGRPPPRCRLCVLTFPLGLLVRNSIRNHRSIARVLPPRSRLSRMTVQAFPGPVIRPCAAWCARSPTIRRRGRGPGPSDEYGCPSWRGSP